MIETDSSVVAADTVEETTVSVVIPAYNVAAYIDEALTSVFAQTFTDFEVIVVNDGSPDTPQLEEALTKYRDRIVYIKQENQGAASARNTGLRRARGRYVAFLDSDDLWLPNYLEEQLRSLDQSKADLVYADALLIGDSPLAGRTYMETSPSSGEVTAESLLALRCNVITSGVLVRRQPVLDVGMFDETIKRAHDFELWFRLAKHGARLSYQKRVLLKHRILNTGLSGDTISQQERALKVLSAIHERGDLTRSEKSALERTLETVKAGLSLEQGKAHLLKGNFADAAEAIESANRFYKSWKLRSVLLGIRVAPQLVCRIYRRAAY